MAFCCWRQSKTQDEEIPEHLHPTWPRRFSLSELQVATSNFSNKNILGRGGFGTTYKGRLLDGSLVAVRISKQMQYFQTELNIRGIAIHRNLICLRGFCVTPSEQFLVYPYMVNGNLASCLQDRLPTQPLLNWSIRKHIALEVARGLAYLHDDCNPKIIHRNVKAANILLDEEFEVVIQGFELAKFMDRKDTDIDTIVCGTFGYIAPEYLCSGKLTEKIDVFAYGVMLLELVTGHRAFDLCKLENDDDVRLLDWVKGLLKEKMLEQLVDCDMDGNYIEEEVEQLIQVALLCTQGSPTDRPKMSDVIRMLQDDGLDERWEKFWQKEEMFDQDFTHGHDPRTSWVTFDSISNIQPDELTSPR